MLSGAPLSGSDTGVYGLCGIPQAPHGEPAGIILVHGGGGTVYREWVEQWRDWGFTALAVDTCGAFPGTEVLNGRPARIRHEMAGPDGWGGFETHSTNPRDHWVFHAVGAVVAGRNYLRDVQRIDSTRIAVVGISWGGFLTLLASSVTDLGAAVAIYGSGYLRDSPAFAPRINDTEDAGSLWTERWDPSNHLQRCRSPLLMINGTEDPYFPLSAWLLTADIAPNQAVVFRSLRPELVHGTKVAMHIPEGKRFIQSCLTDRRSPLPPVVIWEQRDRHGLRMSAGFDTGEELTRGFLMHRQANGSWSTRELPSPDGRTVQAPIENEATCWIVSCESADGCVVSSRVQWT